MASKDSPESYNIKVSINVYSNKPGLQLSQNLFQLIRN
nr:MAG TPA: hypothetical protein [Caudoviricetes sp.]